MTKPSSPPPKGSEGGTDTGSSRARWIAIGLIAALVLWMGSGFVLPSEDLDEVDVTRATRPIVVGITGSEAQPVTRYFVAEGQAEAARDATMRTEAGGEILELDVRRGDYLTPGQQVLRIAPAGAREELARAEEEQRRTLRDYENAQELLTRGFATPDRVAQARTALAAADAQLAAAREAVQRTIVRAPFEGRLETLLVAEGEFVTVNQEVGRIVDIDPLTVAISVPQQSVADLRAGQPAEVRFITGATRPGTVTFVGRSADTGTRTFAAEITVENADGSVPAGVSAQVQIPIGDVSGHFVSPAILSLAPDGELGIKTVEDDDMVAFHPVQIVRAQTDGVWVTGLPDTARIITVGQGFVNPGETVDPQPDPLGGEGQ